MAVLCLFCDAVREVEKGKCVCVYLVVYIRQAGKID